jgi:hypothetical protein
MDRPLVLRTTCIAEHARDSYSSLIAFGPMPCSPTPIVLAAQLSLILSLATA